ncbi:MAG: histidine phosphatase family protein [Candidatus Pacebacteria bacterium]|nr:histidine phosphatase family protein [Candidatus Paceibacterota bacterium]MCF7857255.1 histidine phosphatase family protein [Candidatus Paceibacterota bacterium]
MHVYFVRHGETELNKKHIHQTPNTGLSEGGKEAVLTTGELLRGVNPDLLLTSEYTRAVESAKIIGSCVGLSAKQDNLFYEIMRPSKLSGKSHFGPGTFWYIVLSVLHRNDPSWRYEDAENPFDISGRAKKALRYLESLQGTYESVIVVSHTIFINLMISYMCDNRMLSIRDLMFTFLYVKRMKNAGVAHLEYVGKTQGGTCGWKLVEMDMK